MILARTHKWNLLTRILWYLSILFGIGFAFDFIPPAAQYIGIGKAGSSWENIPVILVCLVAPTYLGSKTFRYFDTLSAWLYVNLTLRTRISWTEALEIYPIFSADARWTGQGKWYPMSHIATLPQSERREKLINESRVILNKSGG